MIGANKKKGLVVAIIAIVIVVAVIVILSFNYRTQRIARILDLGQQYLLAEDYENAVESFKSVLEIDPKNSEAISGAASAYTKWAKAVADTDGYEDAIAILDDAMTVLPENDDIRTCMADIYLAWGEELLESGETSRANEVFHEGYTKTEDDRFFKYIDNDDADGRTEERAESFDTQYADLFESVYSCREIMVFDRKLEDWTEQEARDWVKANAEGIGGEEGDEYWGDSWSATDYDSSLVVYGGAGLEYFLSFFNGYAEIYAFATEDEISDIPYLNTTIDQIFIDNNALELLKQAREHPDEGVSLLIDKGKWIGVSVSEGGVFLSAGIADKSVSLYSMDGGKWWSIGVR